MQRQKKQFLIMIILLVVGVAAYIGIRVYNDRQEEKKAAEEEAEKIKVTELNRDDIIRFSYLYEGETLEFEKEDDAWYYTADKSILLDGDQISSMLGTASSLTAATEVTDYDSLADYGLEEPSNTITLQTTDTTITLYVGDTNEMLSQYYVKKDGDDAVYLISANLSSVFGKSVSDLTKEEEATESVSETESE